MKVFLNKPIPATGMEILKAANIDLLIPEKTELDRNEWLSYCRQADVVAGVGRRNFDKDFFEQCPDVKAISLYSVGYDQVDIAEATKRKIPVSNTPDVLSRATSDIAFLLMQSVARKAAFHFKRVTDGKWGAGFDPMSNLGQELYGKTLGIYGLGRIGYEMARKCKYAFDMKIIYHNRSRNENAEKDLEAVYVPFHELIKGADVLSIHANYTPEQEKMFNQSVFRQMKSKAILVNTARGGFINEADLYHALTENVIWGAGLDVTHPEPISPGSPLLELSSVCVLPHIGSATIEARNGMARLVAENIIAFSKGERMPNVVNKAVYQ